MHLEDPETVTGAVASLVSDSMMGVGDGLCRPGPGGAPCVFAATVAGPTSDGDSGAGVVSRPMLQGENT